MKLLILASYEICQNLSGKVLQMSSGGFWRWCISIKRIVILDFIHRLVCQEQKTIKLKNYRQKIKP